MQLDVTFLLHHLPHHQDHLHPHCSAKDGKPENESRNLLSLWQVVVLLHLFATASMF